MKAERKEIRKQGDKEGNNQWNRPSLEEKPRDSHACSAILINKSSWSLVFFIL